MSIVPFDLPCLPVAQEHARWGSYGYLEHEAIASIARLDGMMCASAKADLFWITWLMKEAQCSNVIEGTVTSFDEVIAENAGVVAPPARRDDVHEVLNYRSAMLDGLDAIDSGRNLSLGLIKSLHANLLKGARGETKRPEEFRSVQVHIGRVGEPIEKAAFIPPEPIRLLDLLENWVAFLSRNDINPVVQVAVAHAQFEMIHPFLDGNGRMGRLLITLFLASKRLIHKPCFYISSYLQSHRDEYYLALGRISKHGDWDTWISFFLNGVVQHSESNLKLLNAMTSLYESSKVAFADATNSSFAIATLDYVFANPVFTIPNLAQETNSHLTNVGITQVIKKLKSKGLVSVVRQGKGKRPTIYKFDALLSLLS
ncbi:Fic family protein [Sutterella sp.]|uniref:Fic family protein n=1 Tax=Sutterella sp. TaxID=1981025 RepID=UPI003FD872C7